MKTGDQLERQISIRGSPGTLGEVLYSNSTGRLVTEADWVTLVRSVAAGDQDALHALYDRTNRIVFTYAVRITASRENAEEVTLDVFHDVWRRASGYDPENGTVLGWIMNQARSRAIDRVRFEQRKKRVDPRTEDPLEIDGAPDPRELLELKQNADAVRAALRGLTPDERNVVEAAFFAGLTHAEIAARLDQPLGTVKTRIRTGLQKLRRVMAEDDRS